LCRSDFCEEDAELIEKWRTASAPVETYESFWIGKEEINYEKGKQYARAALINDREHCPLCMTSITHAFSAAHRVTGSGSAVLAFGRTDALHRLHISEARITGFLVIGFLELKVPSLISTKGTRLDNAPDVTLGVKLHNENIGRRLHISSYVPLGLTLALFLLSLGEEDEEIGPEVTRR
jgi:hypothetical protein